eukprot:2076396-Prymnesium_polylepis.1
MEACGALEYTRVHCAWGGRRATHIRQVPGEWATRLHTSVAAHHPMRSPGLRWQSPSLPLSGDRRSPTVPSARIACPEVPPQSHALQGARRHWPTGDVRAVMPRRPVGRAAAWQRPHRRRGPRPRRSEGQKDRRPPHPAR